MCNIFICLLKLLYTSSDKFDQTNDLLCVRTTSGNYYGVEISTYLPQYVKDYTVKNPNIIHISFTVSLVNDVTVYSEYRYYTYENHSSYFIIGNNRSKFDPTKNIMDAVTASTCERGNYWMYIDYAFYVNFLYDGETKLKISNRYLDEKLNKTEDKDGKNKDDEYSDNKFITTSRRGTINIPDLKYVEGKWIKSFNYNFSDKIMFIIMETIWLMFREQYQSGIIIDYI